MRTPFGDKSGVLDLVIEGNRLTGSLSHDEYFASISDGRVEGNLLRWSAKITQPMRLTFRFTATVSEDRIRGSAKHLFGTAEFSGRRA